MAIEQAASTGKNVAKEIKDQAMQNMLAGTANQAQTEIAKSAMEAAAAQKAAVTQGALTGVGSAAGGAAQALLDKEPQRSEGKSSIPSGNVSNIGKASAPTGLFANKPSADVQFRPSMAADMLRRRS